MPYLLNRRHAVIAVLALAGCTEAQPAITPREAHERAARGELVLVDIRTPEEWRETGLAEHALPIDMLRAARAAKGGAVQDRPVALICRTANRSRAVQDALLKAGYTAIIDVKGGMAGNLTIKGWIAEGLPVKRLP
ncbi:MAG: rhodanese-like domain-containing protein [Beijerinckiaceae bacterium]